MLSCSKFREWARGSANSERYLLSYINDGGRFRCFSLLLQVDRPYVGDMRLNPHKSRAVCCNFVNQTTFIDVPSLASVLDFLIVIADYFQRPQKMNDE